MFYLNDRINKETIPFYDEFMELSTKTSPEILNYFKQYLNIKTDIQVVEILKVGSKTVSNWKDNKTINNAHLELMFQVMLQHYLAKDYISLTPLQTQKELHFFDNMFIRLTGILHEIFNGYNVIKEDKLRRLFESENYKNSSMDNKTKRILDFIKESRKG